ncbi:MAG: class I SAM-dependent methyltransferase [Prevotella sp.]|nr:class I SAM-dependent methyltransferase [Prevotella sp.]
MINEATWRYIREHANDDVRQLALRGSRDQEIDITMALQQIQGRQLARKKLPTWADIDGVIYPKHLSMEQCSSELTARYKLRVIGQLNSHQRKDGLFIDLTGGFGVDFTFISEAFTEAIYVEQQPELCAIVKENLKTLFPNNDRIRTVLADGVEFLHQLDEKTSLIFLDPARRDIYGGRTYSIGDCTPNVLPLLKELLSKSERVMLKLSPMLDWRKTLGDVGREYVEQVHIVSVGNECKELLLILSAHNEKGLQLFCVNDNDVEVIDESEVDRQMDMGGQDQDDVKAGAYLYEPNASLMKAGLFGMLSQRYAVMQLSPNSHLFVSSELVANFPGRIFHITDISSMNKQELKEKVLPLKQANITTRNFPLSVEALRKRLKISEGGSNYLFATTLVNGNRTIFVCQRIGL